MALQQKAKVLVASTDSATLYSLKKLLAYHREMEITTEAYVDERIVELATQVLPDVLIIENMLPKPEGFDLVDIIKEIKSSSPTTNIIVLARDVDPIKAIEAFKSGAHAYILKSAPIEQIPLVIKAVIGSKSVTEISIGNGIIEHFSHPEKQARQSFGRDHLTKRELEVLSLAAEGCKNIEIACQLGLSERTVKAHMAAVLSKMGVRDRSQAILTAVRQHLITIDDVES